jgi:hypothetical protein
VGVNGARADPTSLGGDSGGRLAGRPPFFRWARPSGFETTLKADEKQLANLPALRLYVERSASCRGMARNFCHHPDKKLVSKTGNEHPEVIVDETRPL